MSTPRKRRRIASIQAVIAAVAAPPVLAVVNVVPLVEPPRCVVKPPCSHCHFCRVHDDGPDYWQNGRSA